MPTAPAPAVRSTSGVLKVLPLAHAQGCRGYLLFDPAKREAAALDLHLDQAAEVAQLLKDNELALRFVIDSHTHADHPSAAQKVATAFGATRVAHEKARHKGAGHHPKDGEVLPVGGGFAVSACTNRARSPSLSQGLSARSLPSVLSVRPA